MCWTPVASMLTHNFPPFFPSPHSVWLFTSHQWCLIQKSRSRYYTLQFWGYYYPQANHAIAFWKKILSSIYWEKRKLQHTNAEKRTIFTSRFAYFPDPVLTMHTTCWSKKKLCHTHSTAILLAWLRPLLECQLLSALIPHIFPLYFVINALAFNGLLWPHTIYLSVRS